MKLKHLAKLKTFWKSIGKVNVGFQKKNTIRMEIKNAAGSVNTDNETVWNVLKMFFSELLNGNNIPCNYSMSSIDENGNAGNFNQDAF